MHRNKVAFPSRILSALKNMEEIFILNSNKDDKEHPMIENPNNVQG